MPRIVPSVAVATVDRLFTDSDGTPLRMLGRQSSGRVEALLAVIEQIPDGLLRLDTEPYAAFLCALAELRAALRIWQQDLSEQFQIVAHSERGGQIQTIRDALARMPDEAPAEHTNEMAFIGDPVLRANLVLDLSSVRVSLQAGEWKGATVLAGSLIEALLLWSLEEVQGKDPRRIPTVVAVLKKEGTTKTRWNQTLDQWSLDDMLPVVHALSIINPGTQRKADDAKEFRNLIHPGRAQRTGQKCTRGTAQCAVGAMELVVEDLEKWTGR